MPREILVDWVTQNGGGKVSVFWAASAGTVSQQRTALQAFLTAIKTQIHTSATWSIRTDGREVDDQTGALTGQWSETSNKAGAGTAVTSSGADATQALIRWNTGEIIGGRFLQGRTFIPGISKDAIVLGNLSAGARAALQTGADGLVTAAQGFGVWHRPVSGSGGAFRIFSSAGVWEELAVLRRRRG